MTAVVSVMDSAKMVAHGSGLFFFTCTQIGSRPANASLQPRRRASADVGCQRLFGEVLAVIANCLYCPDLQQRAEQVGGAAVLHDSTINDTVNVDASEYDEFPSWLHSKPRAFMSSSCRNARNHPFALNDLLVDGDMKVRVGVSNTEGVCLSSFNADNVLLSIMDFTVIWGQEVFDLGNIPSINDLFIEATNEKFVFFCLHDTDRYLVAERLRLTRGGPAGSIESPHRSSAAVGSSRVLGVALNRKSTIKQFDLCSPGQVQAARYFSERADILIGR